MKVVMVSSGWCELSVMRTLSKLEVDLFVGLGDLECPNLLPRFLGILGEKDGVFVKHFLDQGRYLISNRELSSDFSTDVWISHLAPRGSSTGLIAGLEVGDSKLTEKALMLRPKLIFHGHSEVQAVNTLGETTVVSPGPLSRGLFALYDSSSREFWLSSLAIR
ncbi:hypothetical protein HS1genome_0815 [Sulfodiicoccus acidiphilus]|uniref:Phosphoesterase n=1 Tax=Sulfodiicoccus acidiphilus TaxID=1670455 RepID=A0A348B2M4_9CREN|nr:hypothetical protein [Sulfodiicoccus acidiphilus]BBD72426.1 hypothetical protein HS1genome_0815 [Sulfodiicoccus acidiphilus]GGT97209.1 hypothetical protein GCM10007116_13410 [Sulfodiicoccus acidiphilus]